MKRQANEKEENEMQATRKPIPTITVDNNVWPPENMANEYHKFTVQSIYDDECPDCETVDEDEEGCGGCRVNISLYASDELTAADLADRILWAISAPTVKREAHVDAVKGNPHMFVGDGSRYRITSAKNTSKKT